MADAVRLAVLLALVPAGLPAPGNPAQAAADRHLAAAPRVAARVPGAVAPGNVAAGGRLRAASEADRAEARAERAADRVERLTEQYTESTEAVQRGLDALALSFATSARLADADLDASRQLAVSSTRRARLVRAVYAQGSGMGLASSVLDAEDPESALWRASTARRLWRDVLDDADGQVARWRAETRRTGESRRAAEAEETRRLATIAALRRDSAKAAAALAEARKALDSLDARARRLRAVQDARDRLTAAVAAARTSVGRITAMGIPERMETAYRTAATTCPGLRWTLLAAVGQVESGHGRNNGPSSAGAVGPMQFMPATFAAHAVDGDGDGTADPWNPEDAVFTAARYLCGNGAGTAEGVRAALLRYNHADWYVDLVLATEQAIVAREGSAGGPGAGSSSPPPGPTGSGS